MITPGSASPCDRSRPDAKQPGEGGVGHGHRADKNSAPLMQTSFAAIETEPSPAAFIVAGAEVSERGRRRCRLRSGWRRPDWRSPSGVSGPQPRRSRSSQRRSEAPAVPRTSNSIRSRPPQSAAGPPRRPPHSITPAPIAEEERPQRFAPAAPEPCSIAGRTCPTARRYRPLGVDGRYQPRPRRPRPSEGRGSGVLRENSVTSRQPAQE